MGRDQLVQEIEVSGCENLVQLEIVAHERYSAHTWGWAVIVDEMRGAAEEFFNLWVLKSCWR